MSRDVIDFNKRVYHTALELAESRGASESTLQGLASMREFTNEALKDTDTVERFADLLTEGTETRDHAADVLSALQGLSFRLTTYTAGSVSGRRVTFGGRTMDTRELLDVRVTSYGDIWLELFGGHGETLEEIRLPCTGRLLIYYNSYELDRKYVYSLWVTAYLTVLAQNILQYNIPTRVPFMDEEG